MRKGKLIAWTCLALGAVLILSACGHANVGVITPVGSDSATEAELSAFRGAGVSISASEAAQMSAFSYRWREPVSGVRVWAELYRDGQLVSDPVEVSITDLKSETGTIALFTDEINGDSQEFALFVSNGDGADARMQVGTGVAELGAAMSPASTLALEDVQVTERGETNVLLVMHDGPNLDTEMENTLNDTEQMIAASTYTLVLNCEFT